MSPSRPGALADQAGQPLVSPHAGGDATLPDDVHLPRLVYVLLVLAAAWMVVTGLRELRDIAGPLLLTLNLFIVAYPVQAWLVRHRLPRLVGAVASGGIVFAILIAFLASIAWSLVQLVREVPRYQDEFFALYQSLLTWLQGYGISEGQLLSQVRSQLDPGRIVGIVQAALAQLTSILSLLVVTVTIIFVVLIDSTNFPRMLKAAAATQPLVVVGLGDFARGVRRYWVVSSIFGLIVAALDIAALMWLGVPLSLVWGLLSFLTNYIPNVGFVLGLVPPALMALLANGPTTALAVVVAYSLINFVIQSIIQPKFNGSAIGVNATVSLLSLLFWAWVLGPLGALLALPATLLAKALLIDIDPKTRWLNAFLASRPETAEGEDEGRGSVSVEPEDEHVPPPPDRPDDGTEGTVRAEAATDPRSRPPADDAATRDEPNPEDPAPGRA